VNSLTILEIAALKGAVAGKFTGAFLSGALLAIGIYILYRVIRKHKFKLTVDDSFDIFDFEEAGGLMIMYIVSALMILINGIIFPIVLSGAVQKVVYLGSILSSGGM